MEVVNDQWCEVGIPKEMNVFSVQITAAKLNELRMLADWQLRQMGFNPNSVTAACLAADDAGLGRPLPAGGIAREPAEESYFRVDR